MNSRLIHITKLLLTACDCPRFCVLFEFFTPASHRPEKFGAVGGEKYQFIPPEAKTVLPLLSRCKVRKAHDSSFSSPRRLVPLSLYMSESRPRMKTNLRIRRWMRPRCSFLLAQGELCKITDYLRKLKINMVSFKRVAFVPGRSGSNVRGEYHSRRVYPSL